MTSLRLRPRSAASPEAPNGEYSLEPGDHLDRRTFHALYQRMPPDTRAELVGGVVYMPSPLKRRHGRHTTKVHLWLGVYETATPGVESYDNTTILLADDGEPQPDACLLISPESGGLTTQEDDYIVGPPELVVEVASSTVSYDLHSKKADYEKAGVREYLAIVLSEPRVIWFINREGRFEELMPGTDGIYRSEAFPGLWLDPAALLRLDSRAVLKILRRGLASAEHRSFVERLASRATPG